MRVIFWGPVLAWLCVIAIGSSGAGRSDNSRSLIVRFLDRTSPETAATLTPYQIDCLNYAARKTAHIVEFAVLGLLLLRGFQRGSTRLRLGALSLATVTAGLGGALDELHQMAVGGRTPLLSDVLIDLSGAAVAIGAASLWFVIKALERKLAGPADNGTDPARASRPSRRS